MVVRTRRSRSPQSPQRSRLQGKSEGHRYREGRTDPHALEQRRNHVSRCFHVRLRERRRVVDAVADHRDDVALTLQPGDRADLMTQAIPKSRSRKVNGYVKAVVALEAVRMRRENRYDRFVRPMDRKRDQLAVEVATRLRALNGGQQAAAQRLLAMARLDGLIADRDLAATVDRKAGPGAETSA